MCLVAPAALAQSNFKPGYILPPSGDTLRGEVDYRSEQRNRKLCRFRPAGAAAVTEYQPEQLLGFGYSGGRSYQSRQLPGATAEKAFLQVLALGKASLYLTVRADDREAYYAGPATTGPLELLVQRDTSIVVYNKAIGREINTLERSYPFRSKLALLMSDCPKVQASIVSMELKEQKLLKLFSEYNACVGGSTPQYVVAERKAKVRFSVLGGVYQSEMKVTENDKKLPLEAAWQPTFGVGIVVNPGFFHHKLSAGLQALYVKQSFKNSYTVPSPASSTGLEQKDVRVDFSMVQLPLLLRYTFLEGPVRPYLQAGFQIGAVFQKKAEVVTTRQLFGSSTREIEMRTMITAPVVAAGISLPTGSVGSVQLEARMGWQDSYSQATQALTSAKGLSLLAGYTFGK
ncbi:Outer membrane protein beta-barrel domain-containing protein [Hymenobacter psychrotolerans DSM 18569]|uniref:Outer membrane protein beta-barrel domain-containing protein n=1 Tax=Hymenobacter psychrotolerans DSM 18569 TaxID=1121959 RepID=A0A1M6TSI0_9BACT|nr:Outer membrane protein beta-barrel domain-containing protein [Hymenobacter psychrotolerans DSM 18569]